MGSALDLWTAYRERAFLTSPQPFLGYFFMLEDCKASNRPVKVQEPHFKVFPEFVGASYLRRYELFCRKLVLERHYTASAFIASTADGGIKGRFSTPAEDLSLERFARVLVAIWGALDRNMETTVHRLINGDSRNLSFLSDDSIHLVVTSPPYWNLKRYNENPDQLGHIQDYEAFLLELEKVWRHIYRILVPGGRLVCVVGDVCVARREFGRHLVFPLHGDICVICRRIGFDNLNPIIWHKIANASYEVENGSKFLGKPYEPNAIIKNDIEFILMQRKPGGYRKPTNEQRDASRIAKDDFDRWFQQIWNITGASTKRHPAPFPLELATRLVRMFSFTGDTVLDPFCGSGTTMVAALRTDRNSIGVEIDLEYCRMTARYLKAETADLFSTAKLMFEKAAAKTKSGVKEDSTLYEVRPARKRLE